MATLNIKQFPDDRYQQLRRQAEKGHRSISKEVIHIVTNAPQATRKHSILELRGLGKETWRDVDPAAHVDRERHAWD